MRSFQAEDEIAAISASIGASFGGALGVTATSGPGVALKGEAIGLAFMLELPLVIINDKEVGLQQVYQPKQNKPICYKLCMAEMVKHLCQSFRRVRHRIVLRLLRSLSAVLNI